MSKFEGGYRNAFSTEQRCAGDKDEFSSEEYDADEFDADDYDKDIDDDDIDADDDNDDKYCSDKKNQCIYNMPEDRNSFVSSQPVPDVKDAFTKIISVGIAPESETTATLLGSAENSSVLLEGGTTQSRLSARRKYFSLDQICFERKEIDCVAATDATELEVPSPKSIEGLPELDNFHRIQEKVRYKYCSTNTSFAQNTIVNPNTYQLFFCISASLQARIYESIGLSSVKTVFDVMPEIQKNNASSGAHQPSSSSSSPSSSSSSSSSSKSSESSANTNIETVCDVVPEIKKTKVSIGNYEYLLFAEEMCNDDVLLDHIHSGAVPCILEIIEYINLLYTVVIYSAECNIVALIYINRVLFTSSLLLTNSNWRSLWTTAVMLAQKVWDDTPMRSSGFSSILNISRKVIKNWELEFLGLIKFSTNVSKELYGQYYFALRSFYNDTMTNNKDAMKFALKPLTRSDAELLEARSDIRRFEWSRKLAEKVKLARQTRKQAAIAESNLSSKRDAKIVIIDSCEDWDNDDNFIFEKAKGSTSSKSKSHKSSGFRSADSKSKSLNKTLGTSSSKSANSNSWSKAE